jgi:OOP family OmpA-OmpF porin
LSFEFGAAPKKKEVVQPCPEVKPEPPAKLEKSKDPVPPPTAAKEPERIEIKQIVPFRVDSAVIDTSTQTPVDEVLKILLANPNYHVQINGHSSSEGPPEPYNTNLSKRRAQAVYDFLKARGVPADHMAVKAFGSTKPVASNDTATGRVMNRRVEFEVDFVILPNGAAK